MEFHRPRVAGNWRELFAEIGVIVIGVLIALSAEQVVDYLHWRHKVSAAEESMRAELMNDRTYATEYAIFSKCSDSYLERLEADLLKHDTGDLNRLYGLGPPFTSHPWTTTAWDAALDAQIADHMPQERFLRFAEAFRRANIMRDVQYQLRDHDVAAMTGRFGLSTDAKVLADELVATEEMKTLVHFARIVAARVIEGVAALDIDPDKSVIAGYEKRAARCEAMLALPH